MAKEFPLVPTEVEPVSTKFRRLSGFIPNPETVREIEKLREAEPVSMRGQAPVIWDRAAGVNVYDAYGNMWLDFSSGVLVTNAGHGCKKIAQAIIDQASKPLLTTYCFSNRPRIELVQKLVSLAPRSLNKAFVLSTGAESTECALKLMRTHGQKTGTDDKNIIVSFEDSFHGRTLGAQQMGRLGGGEGWIKNLDPEMVQIPFPDGFRCQDTSFELFEKTLGRLGVEPGNVAGVISETYQGAGPNFMPKQYAKDLRRWCSEHGALLCFDEVQAGFGRCGRLWGFELYDVVPDLFCIGKGVSSSLPLSGVIGTEEVMDLYGPNAMTSTHSGNPICCAAALASIEVIEHQKLVENAARVGLVLQEHLRRIRSEFYDVIGFAPGAGLVGGLLMVNKGTREPNYELAWNVVDICFRNGLLMFAPVGVGGGCVKIAPPLCISEEAVAEGCEVIREVLKEAVRS